MSNKELQEEEKEVLLSIYEGDNNFKEISPTVYQYKYGEDNHPTSFLLEVSWNEDYPLKKPSVNMDMFYNKHLTQSIKDKVSKTVLDEAEQYLGSAMTYTLFEFVKEKEEEFRKEISDQIIIAEDTNEENTKSVLHGQENNESKKALPKKEQLSKAQKRRQWDKVTTKGEKPRGWNWVDLVKHLSQTGHKTSEENKLPNN